MSSSVIEIRPKAREVSVGDDELTCCSPAAARSLFRWHGSRGFFTPQPINAGIELLGEGKGIHWPEIDEDVSVAGLLRGAR